MTGKAKAIQVMIALSFTAVAYTVYNAASNKEAKPEPQAVQVKSMMEQTADTQQKQALNEEIVPVEVYDEYVPGYSDPEAGFR